MSERGRWWLNEEWDGISFTWDLWYACNYRCSYCWYEMDNSWAEFAKKHLILPPEKWLECWKRIYDRYGSVRIDVIGGEPMRYPSAIELFRGLTQWHRVSITTNLSNSMEELGRLVDGIQPDRLHVAGSYHPQFAHWEEFVEKINFLRDRNFEPHVSIVAWPPFFSKIREWREFFEDQSRYLPKVPFTTLVFQGRYEGKDYPAAYTVEEKALLGETILLPEEFEYRLERRRTKGKPCAAGHVYGNIKANGDVYRCGQDFGQRPLGNLFDPEFQLHPVPEACPYEYCSCGEYAFLLENWKLRKALSPVMRLEPAAERSS